MPATSKPSRSAKAALVAAVILGSAASTSMAHARQQSTAPRAGENVAVPVHSRSVRQALEKRDRHAQRAARRGAHRRPRSSASLSAVVHTEGGQNGNYTSWEFRGCSQFASGGYQWNACKFDWFFGGQSQFTTWDYYYFASGTWRLYGTYRCEAPVYGGACRWL